MKRSPTEKAPQNRPKRSKISRAWPTPVTAPRRTTISWFTTRTGMSRGRVQSRRQPVVLAGLRVGGDPAGVVVAHHHDEPGPDDGQQGQEAGRPGTSRSLVVLPDGAEGTVDATAHVGRRADARASTGDVKAWSAMSGPPGGTGVGGVHERRARPTQVSPRSAQWPSFLPDGVRALIVVVTHCQRAALLLHLALRESRPDVVASGGRPDSPWPGAGAHVTLRVGKGERLVRRRDVTRSCPPGEGDTGPGPAGPVGLTPRLSPSRSRAAIRWAGAARGRRRR